MIEGWTTCGRRSVYFRYSVWHALFWAFANASFCAFWLGYWVSLVVLFWVCLFVLSQSLFILGLSCCIESVLLYRSRVIPGCVASGITILFCVCLFVLFWVCFCLGASNANRFEWTAVIFTFLCSLLFCASCARSSEWNDSAFHLLFCALKIIALTWVFQNLLNIVMKTKGKEFLGICKTLIKLREREAC